ncbi:MULTISPECIES: hypothetical protein [Amycolatopsis]|nr:hypothetical protein [Amycolatopsis tucumanensis]MCF6425532.1 hypothetical protein [Amycolatopsis tucumanensis]
MTFPPPPPSGPFQRPRQPRGGTAITAGVLGCLGALWAIAAAVTNLAAIDETATGVQWVLGMRGMGYLVEFVLLLTGAVLLFSRKAAGRWLLVGGSALHVVQTLVAGVGYELADLVYVDKAGPSYVHGDFAIVFLQILPAVVTLVMALVPATARWCAPRPGPYTWAPHSQW